MVFCVFFAIVLYVEIVYDLGKEPHTVVCILLM
jgi:hypothetical protein